MPNLLDNNAVIISSQLPYISTRKRIERLLAQFSMEADNENSPAEARIVSEEELVNAVQKINKVLRSYGIQFETCEESGHIITRLVDRENGELIRQIPSEEALAIAQRLEEVKGRLLSLEA